MRSRLSFVLAKKLHVFCEHSTLHGVYYLQKGPGTVVAWSIFMLAGCVLWGVLSHMIWQKYSSDPTVTLVESTFYSTEQIPFPALMICDPQPIYGPKTGSVSHILSSRGYSKSQIEEYYDSFSYASNTDYVPPMYIRKMHALLQDLDFTVEFLLEMAKKPCDVTLVKCAWRSVQYKCSEMFIEVATVVGHCCLFDINHFKNFARNNTKFVPGNTISEGLEVTLNGIKAYSNATTKDGPLLMYMFDGKNNVTNMESSITLAPSGYFEVQIEIYAIESSPDVKGLALKSRKCSLITDRSIGASYYQKCISSVIMRKVVEECKCIPFMYSAGDLSVEDYPSCNWDRYLCIFPQLELTFADMHSLIRAHDCYHSCDYVEYNPKVEFIRKYETAMSEKFTKLAVHYSSRTCLKYKRDVIYTWDQMLANLGGVFGLCLGGSIISVIEIVWFLIDLLATIINYYNGKSKQTEKKITVNGKRLKKQNKNENGCYKFTN